jgi:hypothetical protein
MSITFYSLSVLILRTELSVISTDLDRELTLILMLLYVLARCDIADEQKAAKLAGMPESFLSTAQNTLDSLQDTVKSA